MEGDGDALGEDPLVTGCLVARLPPVGGHLRECG